MLGLGWPELLVIALVGFFVFGPERLPALARDAARMIKQLRVMADGATAELRSQLPSASEFGLDEVRSLRDLHPKAMLGRALFDDEEGPDLFGDRQPRETTVTAGGGGGAWAAPQQPVAAAAPVTAAAPVSMAKEAYGQPAVREAGAPPPYDLDAT